MQNAFDKAIKLRCFNLHAVEKKKNPQNGKKTYSSVHIYCCKRLMGNVWLKGKYLGVTLWICMHNYIIRYSMKKIVEMPELSWNKGKNLTLIKNSLKKLIITRKNRSSTLETCLCDGRGLKVYVLLFISWLMHLDNGIGRPMALLQSVEAPTHHEQQQTPDLYFDGSNATKHAARANSWR